MHIFLNASHYRVSAVNIDNICALLGCTRYSLSVLCRSGNSVKHHDEAHAAVSLAAFNDGGVGNLLHADGALHQLCRPARGESCAWSC